MFQKYPTSFDVEQLAAAEQFLADRGFRPERRRFSVEELKLHLANLGCQKIAVGQMADHIAAQAEIPRFDPASGEHWQSRETVAGWTPEIALTFLLEKVVRERED